MGLLTAAKQKIIQLLHYFLQEYVIVLLRNGRHKEEAKKELNVFLGDDSDSFINWYSDHYFCWPEVQLDENFSNWPQLRVSH